MRRLNVLLALVAPLALISCAGLQPRYHEVSQGQSVEQIARYYHVPVVALRKYNKSAINSGLRAGDKLYIPFEESPYWNAPYSRDLNQDLVQTIPSHGPFMWPVSGYISSGFGPRRDHYHAGIDIPARTGTPVRAARSGHVIYAGNQIPGYGNMVIVQHPDKYSTVYAHLSKMDVRKGQFVSRGQKIGGVGETGHATSPHLHFEIRENRIAVNPLFYLQGQYARSNFR